jgi:hypothetical protein
LKAAVPALPVLIECQLHCRLVPSLLLLPAIIIRIKRGVRVIAFFKLIVFPTVYNAYKPTTFLDRIVKTAPAKYRRTLR